MASRVDRTSAGGGGGWGAEEAGELDEAFFLKKFMSK
jgi:hypothetical protein